MSFSDDQDDDESNRGDKPETYSVGKNRPPKKHQFKPGRSGNPNGRPPKPKPKPAKAPTNETHEEIVLGEAARHIQYGEGGEELTAERLIFRSAMAKAMHGSVYAQKYVLETIERARARRDEQIMEVVRGWMQRKDEGYRAIAHAKVQGRKLPFLFPHPDDIFPDIMNCCVWIYGGLTPEQAAYRASLEEKRAVAPAVIKKLERDLRRNPHDEELVHLLQEVRAGSSYLQLLNLDEPYYFGLFPQSDVPEPPTRAEYHEVMKAYGPEVSTHTYPPHPRERK